MERLDQFLIRMGHLPSRDSAREDILAGKVLVNGRILTKPGYKVKPGDAVTYLGEGRRYVSRGAVKLLGAIEAFAPTVGGARCIDVGASTGGFTQVLLEQGAASVTAVDVGHGQLDASVKNDLRVTDIEGLNFRSIPAGHKDELQGFDLLTMDISFISVCLVSDSVRSVLRPGGAAIILIKPQFEAGRGALNKAGVVKDPKRHEDVLIKVLSHYLHQGFILRGLTPSPIQGPDGNIEYLACLTITKEESVAPTEDPLDDDLKTTIKRVVGEAFAAFEPATPTKGTP